MAFADKLRLSEVATSLGGTHTVVSHVASTTHRQLDDRALAAGGIDPGAVRFSIGLEDPEDLISDAYVALESLSRPLSFLVFLSVVSSVVGRSRDA
jgi:cystathionine gamma-synthase/O-acetylhomoserine (thiol)-lyase